MSTELFQDRIKKLEPVISQEERLDLGLLVTGVKRAMQAYHEDAVSSNLKSWEAAKRSLSDLVQGLWAKYGFKEQAGDPERFETKFAAWEWLVANGWKLGKSQFYNHCKDGLIRPDADGSYSMKRLKKYAETHVKRAETGLLQRDELERLQERKLKGEVELLEVKKAREQHDLDVRRGRFIPREDVEIELAGRAVAFLSGLRNTVQMSAVDWIRLVNGDTSRAAILIDAMTHDIEHRLSHYASTVQWEVILDAPQEDDDDEKSS